MGSWPPILLSSSRSNGMLQSRITGLCTLSGAHLGHRVLVTPSQVCCCSSRGLRTSTLQSPRFAALTTASCCRSHLPPSSRRLRLRARQLGAGHTAHHAVLYAPAEPDSVWQAGGSGGGAADTALCKGGRKQPPSLPQCVAAGRPAAALRHREPLGWPGDAAPGQLLDFNAPVQF